MKQAISKEKAAAALKQEELGVPLDDIIREMGVSRETYLGWRRGYCGIAASAGMPTVEQPPDSNIHISRTQKDEE
jgi:putative transposase